jgi:competence ComEA-like helix-hairpin-helix protein
LNNSNSGVLSDERLTVLLILMFALLIFDFSNFSYGHHWSSINRSNGRNSGEQLSFSCPNKLVIENCSNTGKKPENETIPAKFTPFFFELIPINRADKDMLMSVQGIGASMADTIVAYRQQLGPLKKSADLLGIKGIGPKRAAKYSKVFTFDEVP